MAAQTDKQVGQVVSVSVNLTVPMKIEAENMSIGAITMLVAPNGGGKSLINKLIWLAGSMAQFVVLAQDSVISLADQCSSMAKDTFVDCDLDGTFIVNFENMALVMRFSDGDCIFLDHDTYGKRLARGNPPVYMSTETRTFTQMVAYLNLKKLHNITTPLNRWRPYELVKMTVHHRLYDLFLWESIIARHDSLDLTKFNLSVLGIMGESSKKIDRLVINTEKCTIHGVIGEKNINLALFSAGEQSVLMMCLVPSLA
jgi:hypothetical protein